MTTVSTDGRRIPWKYPASAAVGALLLFIPSLRANADFAEILYILASAFIVIVLTTFLVFRKDRRPAILSALIVFTSASLMLATHNYEVRSQLRWTFASARYRESILNQPTSTNGKLRHGEWEGWGWAGMDTTVYLVFEPTDRLASEIKSHSSGKFSGIPCEVSRAHRLQKNWYYVIFYTNTVWEYCGE